MYSELGAEASSLPISAINVQGVALCDIDSDETYELILYISFLGGQVPAERETFEAWEASIMVGDVEFYAPSS